jgi:hypothetical protein
MSVRKTTDMILVFDIGYPWSDHLAVQVVIKSRLIRCDQSSILVIPDPITKLFRSWSNPGWSDVIKVRYWLSLIWSLSCSSRDQIPADQMWSKFDIGYPWSDHLAVQVVIRSRLIRCDQSSILVIPDLIT